MISFKIQNAIAIGSKFKTNYNPLLMPYYKNSLNEFNNRLLSAKNVNKGYRREARKLLTQAVNLLITLKKEYHLN